jgi:acetate kinase
MNILVLNCGSSSIKCQVFATSPEQIEDSSDRVLAKCQVDRVGTKDGIITVTDGLGRRRRVSRPVETVDEGLRAVLESLPGGLGEIEAVGHRVVHGGERFREPAEMSDEVVNEVEDLIDVAPLHNPHNLRGYYAARTVLPGARHVAVFDTAFHQTMPAHSYLYGIPYAYYAHSKIRRYGFHGVSHRYIAWRYAELRGGAKEDFKVISCHLGNGSSMCAIAHGKSVDTSMGFTPLEGLLMGTRCGDLDPSLVLYLMALTGEGTSEMEAMLNRKSGLYGISGLTSDMKTLLEHKERGDSRAALAIDVFCYRIKKYLGSYMAALNGADALVFTGGIGENSPEVRGQACADLKGIGIAIDAEANAMAVGCECRISTPESNVDVWAIPTNEELLIARDTLRCLLGLPRP